MRRFTNALALCLIAILVTLGVGAVTAVVAHTTDVNGNWWGEWIDGHDHVDKLRGLGGSDELLGRGDGDKLWGGVPSGDVLRGMENGDELHNGDGYAYDYGLCGDGGNDVLFHDAGADYTDGSCQLVYDE